MINEERGNLDGMRFGSPHPSLFSTGLKDPRDYHGPPNPRRCATPAGTSKAKKTNERAATPSEHRRPRSRNGLVEGAEGDRSLIGFNEQQTFTPGVILLDSPRSVEACKRLGLTPDEFIIKSVSDVVEEMKTTGEDTTDSDVVKLRFNYIEKRRKQKLKAAVDERNRILIEESRGDRRVDNSAARKEAEMSSLIDREEKRLQKIVGTNKSRLRQQLLHAQLLQKQRQREDERLENQRRADEREKEQRVRDMMEKSRKEEEAQALRNEARELERREQEARAELRRAMHEAKDQAVKERVERNRMAIESENQAKQRRNAERRMVMKDQAENLQMKRREKFRDRWMNFEQMMEEHRNEQDRMKAVRRANAEAKQEKIEEAIARSDALLQAKINRTNSKEEAAQQKLKDTEGERKATQEAKRQHELAKEHHRQETYAESQLQLQERTVRITSRIRQGELRMKEMLEERSKQSKLRQEVMRQRELDKLDCVNRSKKMENSRVDALEESIASKNNKIDMMKRKQREMKDQRRRHREEVERSRMHIPEQTPGPGDYLLTNGNTGTENPHWKFGLPATALGMQVVSRKYPSTGYVSSPGPCRYALDGQVDAQKKTIPAFSMIRHDRWSTTAPLEVTPGPSDYAAPTPALDGTMVYSF